MIVLCGLDSLLETSALERARPNDASLQGSWATSNSFCFVFVSIPPKNQQIFGNIKFWAISFPNYNDGFCLFFAPHFLRFLRNRTYEECPERWKYLFGEFPAPTDSFPTSHRNFSPRPNWVRVESSFSKHQQRKTLARQVKLFYCGATMCDLHSRYTNFPH